MADSKLIEQLQKETGKTLEECEAALAAENGNYKAAAAKLRGPDPMPAARGLQAIVNYSR